MSCSREARLKAVRKGARILPVRLSCILAEDSRTSTCAFLSTAEGRHGPGFYLTVSQRTSVSEMRKGGKASSGLIRETTVFSERAFFRSRRTSVTGTFVGNAEAEAATLSFTSPPLAGTGTGSAVTPSGKERKAKTKFVDVPSTKATF